MRRRIESIKLEISQRDQVGKQISNILKLFAKNIRVISLFRAFILIQLLNFDANKIFVWGESNFSSFVVVNGSECFEDSTLIEVGKRNIKASKVEKRGIFNQKTHEESCSESFEEIIFDEDEVIEVENLSSEEKENSTIFKQNCKECEIDQETIEESCSNSLEENSMTKVIGAEILSSEEKENSTILKQNCEECEIDQETIEESCSNSLEENPSDKVMDSENLSSEEKMKCEVLKQKCEKFRSKEFFEPNDITDELHTDDEATLKKWRAILDSEKEEKIRLIKKHCFKGIPNDFRLEAWNALLEDVSVTCMENIPVTYKNDLDVIFHDLPRIRGKHPLLNEENSIYNRRLFEMLFKFYLNNPKVGYYQGLDNVAAVFLLNFREFKDEILIFSIFSKAIEMIKVPLLVGDFKNFRSFCVDTEKLIEKHLKDCSIILDFDYLRDALLMQYYITLFCRFDIRRSARFLDVIFAHGIKTMHYFCIAVLYLYEDEFKKCKGCEIMASEVVQRIKNNGIETVNIDKVMKLVATKFMKVENCYSKGGFFKFFKWAYRMFTFY